MGNILVKTSGDWVEPTIQGFEKEGALQKLLADHPALIPGVSAQAKTVREFQSLAGKSDIVVVDATADITLVECKLARNPEVRREVIGQLFDYAARLWRMGIDDFEAQWVTRTGKSIFDPDVGIDPELRETLAANLAERRFRLVLAVDSINEPLRTMVEYVHGITAMTIEVIAVAYEFYEHDGVQILTPRTYGEELAETKPLPAPPIPPKMWTADEYRRWLTKNEPGTVANFDDLIAKTQIIPMIWASGRGETPSGILTLQPVNGLVARPLQLATMNGKATLVLNFLSWVAARERAGADAGPVTDLKNAWLAIDELNRQMDEILTKPGARYREVSLVDLTPAGITAMVDA